VNWRGAVALAGSWGCVEFVAPETPRVEPRPALLQASVTMNAAGDTLRLDAVFGPGQDTLGVRSVRDAALRVGPDALAPEAVAGDSSAMRYRWAAPVAAVPPVLDVAGPTVAGVLPATRSVLLPLMGRAGPREVVGNRATDLVLPLWVGAAEMPPGGRSWSWSLRIAADSGVVVWMGGSGEPPAALTVPAGVFTLVSADSCVLYLTAGMSVVAGIDGDFWEAGAGYGIVATVSAGFDWIVRLGAPPPAVAPTPAVPPAARWTRATRRAGPRRTRT